ncbi:MAG: c-type cytochrome biogenesis protein CcsB [Thermodesulfobacteria bacterium]|nr:c-type cytochrome biogenesis protein CcsB [Thermodesulfobacteriota bacterium]
MNVFFFKLALMVYAVATVGYFVYLYTMKEEAARGAYYVLLVGFGLHTISLVARWLEAGYPPFTNLFEATSFLAWALVLGYLVLDRRFQRQGRVLGAFVTPIATLLMLYSSFCPKDILPLPPVLRSLWLPIHAAISLLSYGFFILAAASGVMYLLQEREIKKKRLGGIFKRLPSLETLDRMNELSLKIGFPLLTLGIITGAVWAEEAWGTYWSWDPKETWSLIMWLVYAALLHERLAVGWRGRKAAWLSIVGFLTWLISFFVVNLFIPGAHTYVEWHG